MLRDSHEPLIKELLATATPFGAFAMGMACVSVLVASEGTIYPPRELLEICKHQTSWVDAERVIAEWITAWKENEVRGLSTDAA